MLAFVWKELLEETNRSKSLKELAKYRNRRGVRSEEALQSLHNAKALSGARRQGLLPPARCKSAGSSLRGWLSYPQGHLGNS